MKKYTINLSDLSSEIKKIIFFVQGSALEPYKVTFKKNGDNLSAYCTCPAGMNGQYCKHRFRILEGSTDGIVSNNSDDVTIVKSWLSGSDVETALLEVTEIEKAFLKAKKDLSIAKKKLARSMRD